ncbi:MAG: glycosyltransferase family 2 protein [Pseudomonadota bacterium]
MPRFCVVVPCFNNEATVGETIRSALASNYDDFAVVVTDNGSKDRSPEIIADFDDPRLITNLHAESVPKTENWNRAYRDVPDCEYLVTLHGDDWLDRDGLAHIARMAEERPALIHGRHDTIDLAGNPVPRRGFGFDYRISGPTFRTIQALSNVVAIPGATIRADLFNLLGGWDPDWTYLQDLEMWWQLSKRGSVHYCGKRIGTYRLLGGSGNPRYINEYVRWHVRQLNEQPPGSAMHAALSRNLAHRAALVRATNDPSMIAALDEGGIGAVKLPKASPFNNPTHFVRLARLAASAASIVGAQL